MVNKKNLFVSVGILCLCVANEKFSEHILWNLWQKLVIFHRFIQKIVFTLCQSFPLLKQGCGSPKLAPVGNIMEPLSHKVK